MKTRSVGERFSDDDESEEFEKQIDESEAIFEQNEDLEEFGDQGMFDDFEFGAGAGDIIIGEIKMEN